MPDPRKAAKERVERLRSFYADLFSYIVINAFLIVVNLLTSPGTLWFYWVSIGWGIGLVFHAYSTFGRDRVLGREWEERKIKEYMKEHPEEGEQQQGKHKGEDKEEHRKSA